MSGYTKEELSLLKVYDLDVCFSKEKLEKLICDGTKNGSVSRRLETQHRRKDGSIYDVEIAVSKAYWKNRPVSLAICRNISERKKVEKSLIKEKENLSAISMFLHELLTVRPGQNVIMKLVVEHAQRWTAGDAAAILLAGEGDLAITLATGVLEDSIGGRASISKSFSGHCLEQGKVILCNDLSHSSICSPILEAMGIQSIIAAPLYINTQRTGVILVTHKEIGKFDEDDVQMLEAMAGVVSTAMSRAAQIESTEILLTERTEMIDTLSRVNQRLENLATQDGLTGIKNHRAFQEELRIEFSRSERYNSQLSLIMVDVDRFKVFNDLFGHVFGDEVLRNVARVLQDNIRISDYLARYGGEEFVIVLPHTDSVTAADVAERCRIGIEETEWKLKNVTASFGVSSVSIMANTPEALIKAADSALYAAKSAGRNRVEIYQNSLLIDDFSLVDIGG
jgi:diguanylate cyclase (GGDEF)-like protein/PAS domain S-box-containing protein